MVGPLALFCLDLGRCRTYPSKDDVTPPLLGAASDRIHKGFKVQFCSRSSQSDDSGNKNAPQPARPKPPLTPLSSAT
ncbi:hypothetical protein N7468_009386 [Penicillium chermesinum]|uniref:Uncharacterized protein n=1 Tax=Penicillium chermesinum TaxID=63820 RepID=A0A9W9NHQ2_9EURO|nr:uncharacterized protein N7468_009386 [Penicillium chermesinum]KAJ5220182.1 hypothetical protein N7468_009386 [Penicillium chermesinum]